MPPGTSKSIKFSSSHRVWPQRKLTRIVKEGTVCAVIISCIWRTADKYLGKEVLETCRRPAARSQLIQPTNNKIRSSLTLRTYWCSDAKNNGHKSHCELRILLFWSLQAYYSIKIVVRSAGGEWKAIDVFCMSLASRVPMIQSLFTTAVVASADLDVFVQPKSPLAGPETPSQYSNLRQRPTATAEGASP